MRFCGLGVVGFWASHIDLHPVFSTVTTAVERITNWDLEWNGCLEHNFKQFLGAVGLEFVAFDAERGVRFRRGEEETDRRVLRAFGRRRLYWSSEEMAPHLLRQVCRARALNLVKRTRFDAEGVEDVDLEVLSCKPWQLFRDSLSDEQAPLLHIFLCGAVSTQTRKSGAAEDICAFCGERVIPSMRHLVVECEHFSAYRRQLRSIYAIPNGWWEGQPRVLVKLGWITCGAHPQLVRRVELQVAVCRMGLVVVDALGRTLLAACGMESGQFRTA